MPAPLTTRNLFLREILDSGRVIDSNGREIILHSHISGQYAHALYTVALQNRPKAVLEVGLAFGISSLAILTALDELGTGHLTSIDPNQCSEEWRGVGIANIQRCGFAARHTLLQKPDYIALPELMASGMTIELAYIEGWHTFDHAFLDFFYIDRMIRPGGIVGFNDAGWRSVHKVLRFIASHRHYEEIDVGLKRTFRARNLLFSLGRRVFDAPNQDRYFRKVDRMETRLQLF